jgi:hypothetical protein
MESIATNPNDVKINHPFANILLIPPPKLPLAKTAAVLL